MDAVALAVLLGLCRIAVRLDSTRTNRWISFSTLVALPNYAAKSYILKKLCSEIRRLGEWLVPWQRESRTRCIAGVGVGVGSAFRRHGKSAEAAGGMASWAYVDGRRRTAWAFSIAFYCFPGGVWGLAARQASLAGPTMVAMSNLAQPAVGDGMEKNTTQSGLTWLWTMGLGWCRFCWKSNWHVIQTHIIDPRVPCKRTMNVF